MKHQVLKTGILATVLALLSIGVNAQTLPSTPTPPNPLTDYKEFSVAGETIDSVTVGSRMPYKMDAQTPIYGLTFEYMWEFTPSLAIQSLTGAALTGSANYYSANEISVVMPAAPGTMTVKTNVRSLFGTTVLCTGTEATNNIRIVPRPTIKWDASTPVPGCVAQAVSIPLTTLTGNAQFEVAYTIAYYTNFDGTGTPTTTTGYNVLTSNTTLDFPASVFASGDGLYEITLTNITDRISRKSLDMSLVASTAADLPTSAFKVYIYPAPATSPLLHIKNM